MDLLNDAKTAEDSTSFDVHIPMPLSPSDVHIWKALVILSSFILLPVVMTLLVLPRRLMPLRDKWRYRLVYLLMATIFACNTAARFYDDVHTIYLIGEICIHVCACVPFAIVVWSKRTKILKSQEGGVALADQLYPGWVSFFVIVPILIFETYTISLHINYFDEELFFSNLQIPSVLSYSLQQFVQFLGILVISGRKRKTKLSQREKVFCDMIIIYNFHNLVLNILGLDIDDVSTNVDDGVYEILRVFFVPLVTDFRLLGMLFFLDIRASGHKVLRVTDTEELGGVYMQDEGTFSHQLIFRRHDEPHSSKPVYYIFFRETENAWVIGRLMSEKARVYARFHRGGKTSKGETEHEESVHGHGSRGGIFGAIKHWFHHQFWSAPLPLSFKDGKNGDRDALCARRGDWEIVVQEGEIDLSQSFKCAEITDPADIPDRREPREVLNREFLFNSRSAFCSVFIFIFNLVIGLGRLLYFVSPEASRIVAPVCALLNNAVILMLVMFLLGSKRRFFIPSDYVPPTAKNAVKFKNAGRRSVLDVIAKQMSSSSIQDGWIEADPVELSHMSTNSLASVSASVAQVNGSTAPVFADTVSAETNKRVTPKSISSEKTTPSAGNEKMSPSSSVSENSRSISSIHSNQGSVASTDPESDSTPEIAKLPKEEENAPAIVPGLKIDVPQALDKENTQRSPPTRTTHASSTVTASSVATATSVSVRMDDVSSWVPVEKSGKTRKLKNPFKRHKLPKETEAFIHVEPLSQHAIHQGFLVIGSIVVVYQLGTAIILLLDTEHCNDFVPWYLFAAEYFVGGLMTVALLEFMRSHEYAPRSHLFKYFRERPGLAGVFLALMGSLVVKFVTSMVYEGLEHDTIHCLEHTSHAFAEFAHVMRSFDIIFKFHALLHAYFLVQVLSHAPDPQFEQLEKEVVTLRKSNARLTRRLNRYREDPHFASITMTPSLASHSTVWSAEVQPLMRSR